MCRAGQKPRWCKRRGICFTAELPERDADNFCHPGATLANKLFVIHPLPPEWKRMLSAHSAPSVLINSELFEKPRDVNRRALAPNRGVLTPAYLCKVGHLVDASAL